MQMILLKSTIEALASIVSTLNIWYPQLQFKHTHVLYKLEATSDLLGNHLEL